MGETCASRAQVMPGQSRSVHGVCLEVVVRARAQSSGRAKCRAGHVWVNGIVSYRSICHRCIEYCRTLVLQLKCSLLVQWMSSGS